MDTQFITNFAQMFGRSIDKITRPELKRRKISASRLCVVFILTLAQLHYGGATALAFYEVAQATTVPADLAAAIKELEQQAAKMKRTPEADQNFESVGVRIDETTSLPVLVRLRLPYRPEGELNGTVAVEAQREMIVRVRKLLLTGLTDVSGYDAQSVKEYTYIPFFAIRINRRGFTYLKASPHALDIQEDSAAVPSVSKSVTSVGANKAWDSGITGKGQTIAVLDTGIEKTHPFLEGKVVAEACFSSNLPEYGVSSLCPGGRGASREVNSGLPCEVADAGCDHGTHVAGIAAGSGPQFAGVARDSSLISVQVFSRLDSAGGCANDLPSCVVSFTSDQIAGLEAIFELRTSHNIAAVNLGLEGGRYTTTCDDAEPASRTAIDLLRSVGIATIVAAGNSGYSDALSAPACISSAISVGATRGNTEQTIQVASFSNSAQSLKLLAPGDSISSSVTGGAYAISSGTSMAAPHVAGAWALLRQRSANANASASASVNQILTALADTGLQVTDSRNQITTPRINVAAALTVLGSNTLRSNPPNAPSNLIASTFSTTQINLRWTDNSDNELGFIVYRRTGNGNYEGLDVVSPGIAQYKNFYLTPGTSYTYYVTAFNNYGRSINSNEVTASTLKIKLLPPTDLKASTVSTNQINLNWKDNSDNESGFTIMRRQSSTGVWQTVAAIDSNTTTYTNNSLKPNSEYVFYIIAYNNAGESTKSNDAIATTLSDTSLTQPPSAPTDLKAYAVPVKFTPKMVAIEWTHNTKDEAGFKIYRRSIRTDAWVMVTTLGPDTKELINVGLAPGETYIYRVSAFNAVGETFAEQEISITAPMYNFMNIGNGEPSSNTIVRGQPVYYRVYIPKGATNLTVRITGRQNLSSDDVDLYIRNDQQPTTLISRCASATKGANEVCQIDNPEVGDWHIMVVGYSWAKTTYVLTATYKMMSADYFPLGNRTN